jgi:hypothetical protein
VQESVKAFAYMRRDTKEKELNALFSGDCDPSLALLRYFCGIILRNLSEQLTT